MLREFAGVQLQLLSLITERTPPGEFRVFAFGANQTTKGTFFLSEEDCDQIIRDRAGQQRGEVMIDYDHLAAGMPLLAGQAKASGWCKLEKRPDGLWAVNVRWTPEATELLKNAEYRFFSPAFAADKQKNIKKLGNIALVNQPAMKDIQPLVAASKTKETAVHKFGAMLTKYMKDQSISPNTLAEKSGIALDRVQKLMGGDEPTQEEMEKCHEHMKFSDADLKECSTNSKDDNESDGTPGSDDKEPPKKVAGKEGEDDPNDEDAADHEEENEKEQEIETSKDSLDLVKLTGTDNPNKQAGILAGWRQSAMKVEKLAKQFEEMKLSRDEDKRRELTDDGFRRGVLSNPLVRLYKNKPLEEFEAFLSVAPVLFAKELHVPERSHENVVLTREEQMVANLTGKSVTELSKFVARKEQAKKPWADGETVDEDILNSYLNAEAISNARK